MATIVTLAQLRAPLPSVDLGPPAGIHAVQPISGTAMQLVQAARQETDPLALWEAAALCVPTAPREAVLALSLAEVQAIIAIATGTADAVLEQLGNGSGGAPASPAALPPEIPSGT